VTGGRRSDDDVAGPPRRRRALAAVGLALLIAVAGCVGGGTETVERDGSPTAIDEAALADAGFAPRATGNRSLNATLTVTLQGDIEGRESVDVAATVPTATYDRGTDGGPAVGAVAASPAVTVIDNPERVRDPLGSLSPAERAAFVQDAYGEVRDLTAGETATVTARATAATLRRYRGTATREGERVSVAVAHVAVRAGDDAVHVVVVAPVGADVDLERLLAGLERG